MSPRTPDFFALLLTCSLFAVACGEDGGGSSGADEGTSSASTSAGDGDGDGDGDGGGDGDGDGDGDGGPGPISDEPFGGHCGAQPGQIFPPDAPWNQSVVDAPVAPESDAIVAYLDAVVTGSQTFRIDLGDEENDYGFNLLVADAAHEHVSFVPRLDENLFYVPACDEALVPVLPGGKLEGEAAYDCASDGDCHLTVLDVDDCRLYEMWKADDVDGDFRGGCLAVWDVSQTPDDELRGLSCTSADAAGLPIMPLLVTPAEIQSGHIDHALRFILPNDAVARHIYARPATHNPLDPDWAGQPSGGPRGTQPPPYGVRLRLRADFETSSLSNGARVMAEALKEYGMFHADGGSVTFIASNDGLSGVKWEDADVALGPNDLRDGGLSWSDFEVVSDLDDTASMAETDCTRQPLDEF